MSRFALIGGAAVLGLAGSYWLTKELRPEKDPDDEPTLGNQGGADVSPDDGTTDGKTSGNVDAATATAAERCAYFSQQTGLSHHHTCEEDLVERGEYRRTHEGTMYRLTVDTLQAFPVDDPSVIEANARSACGQMFSRNDMKATSTQADFERCVSAVTAGGKYCYDYVPYGRPDKFSASSVIFPNIMSSQNATNRTPCAERMKR